MYINYNYSQYLRRNNLIKIKLKDEKKKRTEKYKGDKRTQ